MDSFHRDESELSSIPPLLLLMIGIGVVAVAIRLLAGLYHYLLFTAKPKKRLPEQTIEVLFLILIVLVTVLLLVLHCLGLGPKICPT